jgi:uncharacterized membrane protein HdeD (DUF308 family)
VLTLSGHSRTVTLILGLMFYLQWPSIARWAIGVLVGVNLVTSGVTLLHAFVGSS